MSQRNDTQSFPAVSTNVSSTDASIFYYCDNSSYLAYPSLDWDSADKIFECARNGSLEHPRFLGAAANKSLTLVHVSSW